MTPRGLAARAVAVAILAAPATSAPKSAAPRDVGLEENQIVRRGLVQLRLDPKRGAAPGACNELAASEVAITIGGVAARVTSVEPVPRPQRHWLLLDVSESAEGRRREAQRSARQYLRQVMTAGRDSAALLTVDDDTILVGGPTTDPDVLSALVDGVEAGGGSALRDGLDGVLRQIVGDRHEHLILYWTDGHDTGSIATTDDLLATLARAPNATVFPIALLPTRSSGTGEPPVGAFVFDVAKASGGGVFASNDPRWLDHVRGWIARRFVVAFVPPEGTTEGGLAVAVGGKRCAATVLQDPFARPDAIAGEAPPAPRSWVRIHAKQRPGDDPACAADATASPWDWPLRVDGSRLAGCVLDVVEAHGPLVGRKSRTRAWSIELAPVRFAARDVSVVAPPFSELPGTLAEAAELLVHNPSADADAPSPVIIEGSAFLTQRARIAASLFASRPDYHAFALRRLGQLAEDDLRAIELDTHRAFPGLPAAQIAEIARASRAGRRSIEASLTPTDADLARVLAAWLGDMPAWSFFRDWELDLVNARLAGASDPAVPSRWAAVRARLGRPESVRVAAPLILLHDRERDFVGFRRLVLPRSPGFDGRAARSAPTRVEDRIPDRPMALDVLAEAFAVEALSVRLAASRHRATGIDYAPLEPAWKTVEDGPFRHTRVTLTLESPAARVVLEAELKLADDGAVTIVWLTVR